MRRDPWQPASRVVPAMLAPAVMDDLQNRELDDNDYELLLTLDQKTPQGSIPLHIINTFPTFKFKSDRNLCKDCKICATKFKNDDVIRKIPCGDFFHQKCIDRWLLQMRSNW